ncbi:AraC family transcriptional regulator [Neptuniibacter halophilus]|uniref:AraC family transcriptional regulator n=1 Tax=Neptuniibacter halophilus TaxID=651666 RepID=UPI0025724B47|nr:AraC family transcriptional regulator [Neptuniibacter halophilus]
MTEHHLTLDLRSYNQESHSHEHSYHQLVLPLRGTLDISVDGQGAQLGGQTAAVISAGSVHGFLAESENRFLVADIPSALAPQLESLPAFIQLDEALSCYVAFLHQQVQSAQVNSTTQRQMLLLLIQLLEEKFGHRLKLDRRIEAAVSYLQQNYRHQIPLQALARVASLSPRQLSERFRRQFGMTPQQYQIELRMQQAWQLLEQGTLSIQQIAADVGYSNLAAFSDRFRRHFGKSPRYFSLPDASGSPDRQS